jgi:RNA polymerase sigma factor (TIGR02999 family)
MASEEITRLLLSIREGDKDALNELLPLVYRELHSMAHRTLGHGAGDATLNTTALVHEAYLKLHDQSSLTLQDRKHFYAVAAMAMRQIVIDHARRRQALKRGGEFRKVDLEAADLPVGDGSQEMLALDEALLRLTKLDQRMGRVVELRFFGGLSVEETAEVLEVDPRTVKRDWRKARAILYAALQGIDDGPQSTP